MPGGLREKIAAVNARIAFLLAECRGALRGERNFGPEEVRALSAPVAEMAPIMAQQRELKLQEPEIEAELALYTQQLSELHTALQHVQMMLLANRQRVGTTRQHLDAVSRWAAATKLIR